MSEPTLRPPDLLNLAGQDTGRDHLSHSGLSTLLSCEQRWYWHYEQRLDPAVRPVSLSTGGAFAEAIAAGDPDHAWALIMREHADAETVNAGNPWVSVPSRQDAEITAQTAREAARAYITRYGAHETREHEMRTRIRNPRTGAGSRTFDLLCRVDGLDLDTRTLIEDKLVAQIPRKEGEMDRRLRVDRQVSIGCYATWRTTGVEIETVKYRMTLKPAIRRRQGESHDGYLVRIAAEYATRPDHYLAEFECHRTSDDFLRLELELWRWSEQLRSARADGVFPRNTGACIDYGGCRFLPLCSGEPGAEHQYVARPVREPAVAA